MSNFIQQKPLILASGSNIRAELLRSLGLIFDVKLPNCHEDQIKISARDLDRIDLGYALAQEKALSVSRNFPEQYIIAADQLCLLKQILFDKPQNHQKALEQLSSLNGQWHRQIVCMCIAYQQKIVWLHHEIAELKMRSLSLSIIENYLHDEQPYQSCGSYHFEGQGRWLFEEVRGDESTILGLPLSPLISALLQLKIVQFNSTGSSIL